MTQKDETQKSELWTKRIGSTTYRVNVHFNWKSKETLEDKVLKLLEREVNKIA